MENKGQYFLYAGIILNSVYLILNRFITYNAGWLDFLYGVILGLALVFLVSGLVLTLKTKKKKK